MRTQDFFFGTAFARKRLLALWNGRSARGQPVARLRGASPSLTDCIARVRRTSFRVNFVTIFQGDMRYEKATRSPSFFNNERTPSRISCGLLWSARVRYGSVSRSGLRRLRARAAAAY